MTITKRVTSDLFEVGPADQPRLIRMNQRFSGCGSSRNRKASTIGWWTTEEHEKFLEAMELYPSGPWKKIAQHVGSRNPRQVMTHAQKYRQRIKRLESRKSRDHSDPSKRVGTAPTKEANMSMNTGSDAILDIAADNTAPTVEGVELEPLPHFQICQVPDPITGETSMTDDLLLDELQHLITPDVDSGYSFEELESFDCDELIKMLLGPATNWKFGWM
ncbi:unnamed protein product [Phytophthora fragariaefolia]|uniref:Unnamed protein product n=1 Tax=Phytophthora fragariaefolia TaxID=1490495 RepID=A0A9W6WXU5_9STRA|nr:unnamed protein product [Phytophthora fragariaefolia]